MLTMEREVLVSPDHIAERKAFAPTTDNEPPTPESCIQTSAITGAEFYVCKILDGEESTYQSGMHFFNDGPLSGSACCLIGGFNYEAFHEYASGSRYFDKFELEPVAWEDREVFAAKQLAMGEPVEGYLVFVDNPLDKTYFSVKRAESNE